MKIDQPTPSGAPQPRATKASTAATTGADGAQRAKEAAPASGQVRLLPGTPGSDFDAARVAAIREDIRAGRYQVNPEKIASGLLDSVRDLIDSKKNP